MTKPTVAAKPVIGKIIPTKSKNSKSEKRSKSNLKRSHDSKGKNSSGIGETLCSPKSSSNSKLWSFHQEIAGMMYAFGDSRKPSQDSVALVEDIVHQQMTSVLVQATEITNMRGGRFTSIDDVLFLMKNNKLKLQRIIRYLRLKDLKSKTIKTTSAAEDEEVLDTMVGESNKSEGKRLKMAHDFISSIDSTGELLSLFEENDDVIDDIKQARQRRANRMSQCLDSQAYLEYSEARQMSFSKKIGKFKDWLGIGSPDIKASAAVVEVLSYLAYETVNELVDLALLVKEDYERTNPFTTNIPISCNPLSEHAKSSLRQSSIPKDALPTPTHSPPETPTGHHGNPIGGSNQSSSLTSPVQGGLASSLGTASLASSLSGLVKPSKVKKKKLKQTVNEQPSTGIQPTHIREAVRRYTMFHRPITPFHGFARSTLAKRTLCL